MKALEFIYQDTQIAFILGNEKNVMVNATEMAKAFGKRVDNYLRLDTTKSLISALIQDQKNEFVPSDVSEQKIIYTTNKATYFHRILALDFAAWLDLNFRLWIFKTMDDIIFGTAKAIGKKLTEKETAKKELENLVEKIYETENKDAIQLLNQMQLVKNLEKEANKEVANLKKQYTIFD